MDNHSRNLLIACPSCENEFNNREDLKKHIKSSHQQSKPSKENTGGGRERPMLRLCYTCNMYFQSEDVLTKHIDRNHVNDVHKYCPSCSARPNNAHDLKDHLIQVHDEGWRYPRSRNQQKPRGNHYHGRQHNTGYNGLPVSNRYDALNTQGNGSRGRVA